MSKNHKPHYVPWENREWTMCEHPLKNCTAMRNTGLCGWNSALGKCLYGYRLSPEEIRVGIERILANFQEIIAHKDEV